MSMAGDIIESNNISGEIVDLIECADWKEIVFESYMNQDRDSNYVDGIHKGESRAQSDSVGRRGHLRVVARR